MMERTSANVIQSEACVLDDAAVTREIERSGNSVTQLNGHYLDCVVLAPSSEEVFRELGSAFERKGMLVRSLETVEETLRMAALPRIRCIVLAHRRRFDAADACRRLRMAGVLAPTIALTGLRAGQDYVDLLAVGADHVLCCEDVQRITLQMRTMIRRARGEVTNSLRCGPIRLDRRQGKATVGGVWLDLSRSEFELLWLMCKCPNAHASVEELSGELLGRIPNLPDRKALVQRVTRLRLKLGRWGRLIESERGGYVFRDEDGMG